MLRVLLLQKRAALDDCVVKYLLDSNSYSKIEYMLPTRGIEPRTFALQERRNTTMLNGRIYLT